MHQIEQPARAGDYPWRGLFPWYRQMRQTASVRYDERSGARNVFCDADVQRVLQEHQICSSNRDEEVFLAPERFVVDRSLNRPLAFGAGVHFCLGAPLARLEAKIALAAFLARYPRFVVVEEVVTWTTSPIVFGPKSLPIHRS